MKLMQYALGILLLALPTTSPKTPQDELKTLQGKLTALNQTVDGLNKQLGTLKKTVDDRVPKDIFQALEADNDEAAKSFIDKMIISDFEKRADSFSFKQKSTNNKYLNKTAISIAQEKGKQELVNLLITQCFKDHHDKNYRGSILGFHAGNYRQDNDKTIDEKTNNTLLHQAAITQNSERIKLIYSMKDKVNLTKYLNVKNKNNQTAYDLAKEKKLLQEILEMLKTDVQKQNEKEEKERPIQEAKKQEETVRNAERKRKEDADHKEQEDTDRRQREQADTDRKKREQTEAAELRAKQQKEQEAAERKLKEEAVLKHKEQEDVERKLKEEAEHKKVQSNIDFLNKNIDDDTNGAKIYQNLPGYITDAATVTAFKKKLAEQDDSGNTVLHKAVLKKKPSLVKLILEHMNSDDIFKRNKKEETALMIAQDSTDLSEASAKSALEIVKAYKLTSPNKLDKEIDKDGNTVLHRAVRIAILAKNKSDVDFNTIKKDIEALVDAIPLEVRNTMAETNNKLGNPPYFFFNDLTNKNLDSHFSIIKERATPSWIVVIDNCEIKEFYKKYIKDKFLAARDTEGNTPVHRILLKKDLIISQKTDRKSIIEQLVKDGFDINLPNNAGQTALALALAENTDLGFYKEEIIKLVTPKWIKAINYKSLTELKEIKKEDILKAKDSQGNTPLHRAALKVNGYDITNNIDQELIKIIEYLVETCKFDVTLKNNDNKTAYDLLIENPDSPSQPTYRYDSQNGRKILSLLKPKPPTK